MKPIALLLFVILSFQSVFSEERKGDWVSFYYIQPTPEKFTDEVREMAKVGLLKRDNSKLPLVAFLSQVMAANPSLVTKWLDELEDLDGKQKATLWDAAWYSGTEEAKTFFEERKLAKYLDKPAPKILELRVNTPATLDMLWGYFMATGSKEPIRRIVSALHLPKTPDDSEKLPINKVPEQDKIRFEQFITQKAAMWSLASNCRQHPLVLKHCEALFVDPELPEEQREALQAVLSEVEPNAYGESKSKGDNEED